MYEGAEVKLHAILTLMLYGGEWPTSCFSSWYQWIRGLVGPRTGQDMMKRKIHASDSNRILVVKLVASNFVYK
jgi:hypothetical protein